MPDAPKQEVRLFYSYAREDKLLRDRLEIHCSWLKRKFQVTSWNDSEIIPGEDWERAIEAHLEAANLILLLISPDFLASDYCFGKEMQRALARHKEGTCRVVPILLRPTYWQGAPFSSLKLLPTNAIPITVWPNQGQAFEDVVTELSRTIEDLTSRTVLPSPSGTVSAPLSQAVIQVMIETYNAVREQRIIDPNSIMELAARFQAIAENSEAAAQFPFDAERAANALIQRANFLLASNDNLAAGG